MSFVFGKTSKARLERLHPDGQKVAYRALELSRVDFTIVQTARSHEEQLANVKSGASRTYNSRHVPKQGQSHVYAWDVAAWVNGGISYDWPLMYEIAEAHGRAAYELGIPLDWGACWKRIDLPNFTAVTAALMKEDFIETYLNKYNPKRIPKEQGGKWTLVDGPHFQLPWNRYP